MSYHDPYTSANGQGSMGQHQYHDSVNNFNPYTENTEQHGMQNTYTDNDMSYPPRQQGSGYQHAEPVRRSGFDQDAFVPPKEKSLQGLKQYRHNNRGNLWSKGGGGLCIARFCGCTILSAILLIASIILALALWIRPPNFTVSNVALNATDPLQINTTAKTMSINFGVNISVNNPNYFGVAFQQIKADIFYPINNTHIGGGQLQNVVFKPNEQTNVTFPFSIDWSAEADPNFTVLLDLAEKCGATGATRSQIAVSYTITLGIRVLVFVASPVIPNAASFDCPATASQIKEFIKALGVA